MHHSSTKNIRRCLKRHLLTDPVLGRQDDLRVLDVGGADYNGSYRPLIERLGYTYTSADISEGNSVDVVMTDPDRLPFDDASFDLVICGQTFEHSPRFWVLFAEMVRVCHDDGMIIVAAPSAGPVHRFPVDCYRFLPDSFESIADDHGLVLLEAWTSSVGPFFDVVAAFMRHSRTEACIEPDPHRWRALDDTAQNEAPADVDPAQETMLGVEPALDFLTRVHRTLVPRGYLEIGVWKGFSLVKAKCPAVGVDPYPQVTAKLRDNHRVMPMTAEDFFEMEDVPALVEPLDLVYVDGLHVVEHALMDFMNAERVSHRGTVIIIDDVYPNHPAQASRERITRAWTGDVWKITMILAVARPDLVLVPIDTFPTGSLMVLGADPTSTVLWDTYDAMIAGEMEPRDPDDTTLHRSGAISPTDRLLDRLLRTIREQRDQPEGPDIESLRTLVQGSRPRRLVRS